MSVTSERYLQKRRSQVSEKGDIGWKEKQSGETDYTHERRTH